MKRRNFLATAGTVGIASAVSGASVVSSAYSSMSASVLLKEFNTVNVKALNNFKSEIVETTKGLGLDEKYASLLTTPKQIISQETKGRHQNITFKNKSGQYIVLSRTKKGEVRMEVLDELR